MSLELLNSYLYLPVGLILTLSCFPVFSLSSDSCNQYMSLQKRRINAHVSWNLVCQDLSTGIVKNKFRSICFSLECNTS